MSKYVKKIEVPEYWLNPFSLHGVPARWDKDGQELTRKEQLNIFRNILLDKITDLLVSEETEIKIPEEVRQELATWRPTPLLRTEGLESKLELPNDIRIYYKDESVGPTCTHKSNVAVPQAYFAVQEGVDTVYTACQRGGNWLEAYVKAFSGKVQNIRAYWVGAIGAEREQQIKRIQTWHKKYDAEIRLCPDENTLTGIEVLKKYINQVVGKNVATAQSIEWMLDSREMGETGKVVMGCSTIEIFQTIIGQEAKKQLEAYGVKPNAIVCSGSGSSCVGIAYPFIAENWNHGRELQWPKIIAVEDEKSAPLTQGSLQRIPLEYTGKYLPYILAYALKDSNLSGGRIKASGISGRYGHEVGSWMHMHGLIEPHVISEREALIAQEIFRESEGVEVYPETAYAVAGAIDLALGHKRNERPANILCCLTGGRKI